MAWCWTCDKPLSEPMMAQFTDANMHNSASLSWHTEAWWTWHTRIRKMTHCWFRWYCVICLAPSHYLNQWWLICSRKCIVNVIMSTVQNGIHFVQATFNIRGLNNFGSTWSISWLLMPWLLASPGHQHPWYSPSRIGKLLSCTRKDFNYLCHVNVEEWYKFQIHFFLCFLWKI